MLTARQEQTVTARPTFESWLRDVYDQRFTGAATLHFAQGVPNVVEIVASPTRIVLDRRQKSAHP